MSKSEYAEEWLRNYLIEWGECVPSSQVRQAAEWAGIREETLRRARMKVATVHRQSDGRTCWYYQDDIEQFLF